MKFSSALFASLFVQGASAFGPRMFARTRVASSLSMANVLKLTDPGKELLNHVDVFIFDCDGVIWRVRSLVKIMSTL